MIQENEWYYIVYNKNSLMLVFITHVGGSHVCYQLPNDGHTRFTRISQVKERSHKKAPHFKSSPPNEILSKQDFLSVKVGCKHRHSCAKGNSCKCYDEYKMEFGA